MRISHLYLHPGRYVVATDTPDNGRSTFAECWGAGHPYDRRAVAASDVLGEAVMLAENYGKHADIIDRQTGRKVGKARLAAV